MTAQNKSEERVSFHRNGGVEGVEVRIFGDCGRTWSAYNADFEFLAPSSWSGEVRHRGATSLVEPGTVLCGRPGEVFAARKIWLPGSRASLSIEESSLGAYLAEHGARPGELLPRAEMSPQLNASLIAVFRAFRAECGALALQSALVEFFAQAVPELYGRPSEPGRPPATRAAERIRELLDADPTETVDLATLAREVGLSRFAALRAFKRQYGLPPHAYRMQVRLGLARKALRRGLKPAEIAAECGFFDQSHLTRHFRRLFGITPAEYARVGAQLLESGNNAARVVVSAGPCSVFSHPG
jgi:AraC-like DNA-binding protein